MVGHCSVHSWRLKVQWVLATWVTSPLTTSLWHAPCAAGPLSLLMPPPQDNPPTVSQAWVFLLSATLALIPLSHNADTQVSIPFVESPELSNIASGKPGVGQNLALHASPAARNSFCIITFFFKADPLHFFFCWYNHHGWLSVKNQLSVICLFKLPITCAMIYIKSQSSYRCFHVFSFSSFLHIGLFVPTLCSMHAHAYNYTYIYMYKQHNNNKIVGLQLAYVCFQITQEGSFGRCWYIRLFPWK